MNPINNKVATYRIKNYSNDSSYNKPPYLNHNETHKTNMNNKDYNKHRLNHFFDNKFYSRPSMNSKNSMFFNNNVYTNSNNTNHIINNNTINKLNENIRKQNSNEKYFHNQISETRKSPVHNIPLKTINTNSKIINTHSSINNNKCTPLNKVTRNSSQKNQIIANTNHKATNRNIIGNYLLESTLGKGTFAKVKLATHIPTNKKVAIKIIDKLQLVKSDVIKVYREIEIMKTLSHPNIIKLYEIIEDRPLIYIVIELAHKGEIFDYIVNKIKLTEDDARNKFRQLLSAVEYCHSNNVVHRDLKVENLLLDRNENVKICDFGFSNHFKTSSLLDTFCGSPPYAAPELFRGDRYIGPEVDVWSLGVVFFTFLTGTLPFDGKTLQELKSKVLDGRFRTPNYVSVQAELFLRKFLRSRPQERTTLKQALKDEWLNMKHNDIPPFSCHDQVEVINHDILEKMEEMGYSKGKVNDAVINRRFNSTYATYSLLRGFKYSSRHTKSISPVQKSTDIRENKTRNSPDVVNTKMVNQSVHHDSRNHTPSFEITHFSKPLTPTPPSPLQSFLPPNVLPSLQTTQPGVIPPNQTPETFPQPSPPLFQSIQNFSHLDTKSIPESSRTDETFEQKQLSQHQHQTFKPNQDSNQNANNIIPNNLKTNHRISGLFGYMTNIPENSTPKNPSDIQKQRRSVGRSSSFGVPNKTTSPPPSALNNQHLNTIKVLEKPTKDKKATLINRSWSFSQSNPVALTPSASFDIQSKRFPVQTVTKSPKTLPKNTFKGSVSRFFDPIPTQPRKHKRSNSFTTAKVNLNQPIVKETHPDSKDILKNYREQNMQANKLKNIFSTLRKSFKPKEGVAVRNYCQNDTYRRTSTSPLVSLNYNDGTYNIGRNKNINNTNNFPINNNYGDNKQNIMTTTFAKNSFKKSNTINNRVNKLDNNNGISKKTPLMSFKSLDKNDMNNNHKINTNNDAIKTLNGKNNNVTISDEHRHSYSGHFIPATPIRENALKRILSNVFKRK